VVIDMGTQKKIGNETEQRVVALFMMDNWWVHLFAYNSAGQPCDIIALKDDKSILADVKHCDNEKFVLSRIESNQESCFRYASECGVRHCGFIIAYDIGLYWLGFDDVIELKKANMKAISVHLLPKLCDALKDIENESYSK